MSGASDPTSQGQEWELIVDISDNLRSDGSNYVEWIWSLLDNGIDVPLSGPFADLRKEAGQPLLDSDIAAHLDEQMKIAWRASAAVNHGLQDVVTCCRARDLDAGPLADELSHLFFTDSELALSRAKAIGDLRCRGGVLQRGDLPQGDPCKRSEATDGASAGRRSGRGRTGGNHTDRSGAIALRAAGRYDIRTPWGST